MTPTVAVVITTIGRPAILELLQSAARSSPPPVMIAIADQSGGSLPVNLDLRPYPFELRIVPSSGGASAGRNDAARAVGDAAEVLAFPNDDSSFATTCLAEVGEAFTGPTMPDAVACSLVEGGAPRCRLPPDGTLLDRRTVWHAIEPSMFVRRHAFHRAGGFQETLGTGCGTPWQSGEGTDLLLRLLSAGGHVLSLPTAQVFGPGERRHLTDAELVAKHRRYARGTGCVYRLHDYPVLLGARLVVAPWWRAIEAGTFSRLALRIAVARSIGRLEGLIGSTLTRHTV